MINFNEVLDGIKSGDIACKEHPSLPLFLYSYTKKCFFAFSWKASSILCRGLVMDDKNNPLNNPLPKIFNLDEVEETKRDIIVGKINNKCLKRKMYDKANGHLAILFNHDGVWHNITKGSWSMEFVEQDRVLLEPIIKRLGELGKDAHKYTYMFEIIADYDKHTMHEHQVAKYGNNVAVLLCVRRLGEKNDFGYDLNIVAEDLGCPCAEDVTEKLERDFDSLYNDRNIEGYVIHFSDGSRVKVKTKEYLTTRYMKEFENGTKFKKLYIQYVDDHLAAKEHLPEEYWSKYDDILQYAKDIEREYIEHAKFNVDFILQNTTDKSDILDRIKDLGGYEKSFAFNVYNNTLPSKKMIKNIVIENYDFTFKG